MLCPVRRSQHNKETEEFDSSSKKGQNAAFFTKLYSSPQLLHLSNFEATGQPSAYQWSPTFFKNFTEEDFRRLGTRIGLYVGRNDSKDGYIEAAVPLWKAPSTGSPPFNDSPSGKLERVTCLNESVSKTVIKGFVKYSEKSTLKVNGLVASSKVTKKKSMSVSWSNSVEQEGSRYTVVIQNVFSMATFPTNSFQLSDAAQQDFNGLFASASNTPPLQVAMALLNLFTKYGQYHPQKIVAGAKMYSTYNRNASSVQMGSSFKQSQTISVGVSASSFGSSVSKEVNYSTGSSQKSSQSQTTVQDDLNISRIGGSVWETDENEWQRSLMDASSWVTVEMDDVMHITEILPSDIKTKVNAILEQPAVVAVLGGMDTWQLCPVVANIYDDQPVQIILGSTALGVVALTDLAPAITPATVPNSQRCVWRPFDSQPNSILWTVQSDGPFIQLVSCGLNSVPAYLTADAQGNVYLDMKRSSNDNYRKWLIKPTTTGHQLINVGNFQMLGNGTQGLVVTPLNPPQPLDDNLRNVPSPLSNCPASGLLCNRDKKIKDYLLCTGVPLWQNGDWCITQWNKATNYNVFDQALEMYFDLLDERLAYIFNSSKWQSLVKGLQTQPIETYFKVWDVEGDEDTYDKHYDITVASWAGDWQDLKAVSEAIKGPFRGFMAQFKNYVKDEEGKIEVKWFAIRCVLPNSLVTPYTGACTVAATVPVVSTGADSVLAMAGANSQVVWKETAQAPVKK